MVSSDVGRPSQPGYSIGNRINKHHSSREAWAFPLLCDVDIRHALAQFLPSTCFRIGYLPFDDQFFESSRIWYVLHPNGRHRTAVKASIHCAWVPETGRPASSAGTGTCLFSPARWRNTGSAARRTRFAQASWIVTPRSSNLTVPSPRKHSHPT
jgi:hypothetical protein